MKSTSYHQGDIVLKRIQKLPSDTKLARKNIIAYGEITGHSHTIENTDVYTGGKYAGYAIINLPAPMRHDEHPATETIPAGIYEIRRQQEYFPDGSRQVKD